MTTGAAVFMGAIAALLAYLVFRSGERSRRERVLALGAAVFLTLFSLLAVIRGTEFSRSLDQIVFEYFFNLHGSAESVTAVLAYVSQGATFVLAALSVIAVAFLSVRGRVCSGLVLIVTAGLALSSKLILKTGFAVSRPPVFFGDAGGWSFPSGHVLFATSLATAIILVLRGSRTHRMSVGILLAAAVLAVSLGRIALGAHWLSDVVAGGFLGIGLAFLSALLVLRVCRS